MPRRDDWCRVSSINGKWPAVRGPLVDQLKAKQHLAFHAEAGGLRVARFPGRH
jgi:hypothetical protein